MIRWLPTLSLRVWLGLSYLGVLLLPALALIGTGALRRDLVRQTRWDLEHQGALLAMLVEQEIGSNGGVEGLGPRLNAHLVRARETTLSGVRLVNPDGRVIASSNAELGEDLSADAEVREALRGAPGTVLRPRARVTGMPLTGPSRRATVRVFVATPVVVDGQVVGALVLSRTPREEVQAMIHMAPGLLVGAALALGLTLAAALAAAFILTRSLRSVAVASARVAEGDFDGVRLLDRPKRSHLAEVGAAAQAVETMAVRLRERLAYIGEFASHVSHEFKTPLSTLKGTLELLEDDPAMSPEQRARFLRNAAAEVERLERLVGGLLALARAEEGGQDEPLDLDALLAEVAQRHGAPVQGRAGSTRGDRAQLDAALTNLVENARVHGGAVQIRAARDGLWCAIEVSDDGPGISPANLPRVFDRFFTTRRAGGSSGLGLALVRAIAFTHGGRVEARSRPGQTVFRLELPAGPQDPPDRSLPTTPRPTPPPR